jgi:hypothetical protein
LERSIGELQTLAANLAEDLGSGCDRAQQATLEARICKELLLSISVLLPKLQAARYVLPSDDAETKWGPACEACGEAVHVKAVVAWVMRPKPIRSPWRPRR